MNFSDLAISRAGKLNQVLDPSGLEELIAPAWDS